jgi:cobalt-zinc-cadmium efflux system outer membrane protein
VKYVARPLPLERYNEVMKGRSVTDANVTSTTAITLPEAERVALYLNPRLRAARQAANVAAVNVNHAGLWDDPVLSGDVLRMLRNTKNRWVFGGQLLFSIPISGRLSVEKEQARAESRAAIVEAWGEEQKVILELREAWSEWSATQQARGVYSNEQNRYDNASGYADSRLREGEFSASEASMLRVSRSRVRLEDSRLGGAEERARLRIVGLTGLTGASPMSLVPSQQTPEWNGNPDDIYRTNPDVLLRQAQYEVAEQTLRLEVRKQLPDVSLGPAFEQRDGNDMLGMGFSMPIPILNGNRGAIARADAERDSARLAWESAVEQAFTNVAAAQSERNMARRQSDSLRSLIPSTESQVSDSRTRLEAEDYNTLLLVDSVGTERDAKLSLIDSEAAAARMNAALWALVPAESPLALRTDLAAPTPVPAPNSGDPANAVTNPAPSASAPN